MLAAKYPLGDRGASLASDVHFLLPELDRKIDRLKLAGMGVRIEVPTEAQE